MRSVHSFAAAIFLLLAVLRPAVAGLGPENVAVVVNAGSHSSRTVANAFVHGRGIPVDNIIYLSDVPGFEHIGVDDFRERLLKPVLMAIEDRGLTPQVDCIAWSSDFPYAVDVQSDIAAAGLKLPQVFTPTASINGLTFLYELVLAKDPRYLELNSNWYYRKTFIKGRKPQDVKPPTDDERTRFRDAMKLVQEKKWDKAAEALAELVESRPEDAPLQYNLACALAQTGKADEAMKALTAAVDAGWSDRAHVEKDEDLKSLRERDDYKTLLPKIVPPRFDVEPTVGFRNSYRWNERGERVEEGGRRYLLSVMLAVTSGRGTSIDDAISGFGRNWHPGQDAIEIQEGTFYLLKNGDVRSRTREWAFESAAAELRAMGRKAEVLDGTIPQQKRDVAGAMIGIADFNWDPSGSHVFRGAIVEHLTSFGGVLREHSGQTPLSAFLKAGAAGASGTVTEPFAIQAKFPTAFIHVHYARGATLAEAFYSSVQGPYQLLIVGDPLWRPFGSDAEFQIEEIVIQDAIRKRTLTPTANGESPLPDRFEFFINGKLSGSCRKGESWEPNPKEWGPGRHVMTSHGIMEGPLEVRCRNFGRARTLDGDNPLAFGIQFADEPKEAELFRRRPRIIHPRQLVNLRVNCAGATSITIRAQGEPIAQLECSGGIVAVPIAGLGQGDIKFDAVAQTPLGLARSNALAIRVPDVEANLDAVQELATSHLNEGLMLQPEGHEPIVVMDTRDSEWLLKLKLTPGQRFTLVGVFASDVAGPVGVFQTSGNCEEELQVDGITLHAVTRERWRYYPLVAKRGRHRVTIRGRIPSDATVSPQLSIRYGVEGTQSLDGKRFQHEMK